MRVLVTGHAGYLGSVLTPILSAAGHEVAGIDCRIFAACATGPRPRAVPEIGTDIRSLEPEDLRGFGAVVHLAGISNDPLGELNPASTYAINHLAAVRLAESARAAGVGRFIFASSCSVYGQTTGYATEDSELAPLTAYGHSKLLAERDIAALANAGFSPVFLRNGTLYGMSPFLRGDLVLNNLVGQAVSTGVIRLRSDGTPWRPAIHVEDAGRAIAAVLEAPRDAVHNLALNVGRTDQNYRVKDFAEAARRAVPGSRVELGEGAGPDLRDYRANCDRLTSVLPAFRPRWTIEAGAEQLAAGLRALQISLGDLEGPRLQRIMQVRSLQAAGRLDAELRWRGVAVAHA